MKKLIASFFLAAITPVFSQTFDQVAVSAKSDLEASITQLEKLNEQIVKERQPLQAEESRLKDEAFALRSDLERILRRRDNTDRDLSSLQGEVKALNDNNAYITSLMGGVHPCV
jgi:biopolymer transport protein ExbB